MICLLVLLCTFMCECYMYLSIFSTSGFVLRIVALLRWNRKNSIINLNQLLELAVIWNPTGICKIKPCTGFDPRDKWFLQGLSHTLCSKQPSKRQTKVKIKNYGSRQLGELWRGCRTTAFCVVVGQNFQKAVNSLTQHQIYLSESWFDGNCCFVVCKS